MKKQLIKILTVLSLLNVSCSQGEKKEIEISPKTKEIQGDLSPYFTVEEQSYKIKVNENSLIKNGMLTVALKRTAIPFEFEVSNINPFGTNGGEDYHVGIGIEIFNESSPVVIKKATEGGVGGVYSSEDVSSLFELKEGEIGYVRWSVDAEFMDELKTFKITSALKPEEHESYQTFEPQSKPVSNVDVDNLLVSYEKYVNEYLKFYKKAVNGEDSSLGAYNKMLEKALDLQEVLTSEELSIKQYQKLMAIQNKMTDIASY